MIVDIKQLIEIGKRLNHYLIAHGVIADWSINENGLEFTAQYGADKVSKTLYWSDIDNFSNDVRAIENQALRGLSS